MRSIVVLSIVLATTAVHADPTPAKTERRTSRVHAAWTFAALGAAGVVSGVVVGYVAHRKYESAFEDGDCGEGYSTSPSIKPSPQCTPHGLRTTTNARTLGDVGTVSGFVGLGLIGTAAIVYLTAPRDAVMIAPTASTESAGLVVSGRF